MFHLGNLYFFPRGKRNAFCRRDLPLGETRLDGINYFHWKVQSCIATASSATESRQNKKINQQESPPRRKFLDGWGGGGWERENFAGDFLPVFSRKKNMVGGEATGAAILIRQTWLSKGEQKKIIPCQPVEGKGKMAKYFQGKFLLWPKTFFYFPFVESCPDAVWTERES